MNTLIAFICLCVCAVYAGVPLGLHAPAVGYAGLGYGYGGYGGHGYGGYGGLGYAGYGGLGYGGVVGHAAPVAVGYAAPAVVAAPVAYVDNTHFSYGYQNPHGNGHVSVARTGPIDAHSYTFRSGTWVKK